MLDPLQVFRWNDFVTYLVGVKKELVEFVNQNGETRLVYAAGFGHLDVVIYLRVFSTHVPTSWRT